MRDLEHQEQKALFQWSAMAQGALPELRLLFAVPNGGKRHIAVAAKMKAEGTKKGVPDICLAVARHGYHGLFIEMKSKTGKTTEEQKIWLEDLNAQGYLAVISHGWEPAKQLLCNYLSNDTLPPGWIH